MNLTGKFFKFASVLAIGLYIALNIFITPANAQNIIKADKTSVVVFVRAGCVHCKNEEEFLTKLSKVENDFDTSFFHLENSNDKETWDRLTTKLGISKVTPLTIIGTKYVVGFDNEKTTGQEIKKLIADSRNNKISTDINNPDLKEAGQTGSTCVEDGTVPCTINPKQSYFVTLPIIGKIDAQKYPLFFLSVILGLFDGFNPCAMWVLVTFLVILIEVGNRRKMFVFAGTFILAEAVMYSLILTVWYKTWDFVKLDSIITPIVGGVSIIGGLFFLNEWHKKDLECKMTNVKHRNKIRQKIQELAANKFTLLTFAGILGIAFSVNIIEFACSIGIPQAFTKILELNKLSPLQTVLMIAVYIFFYMIDDFIVFGIALYGIDKLHLTTRYSKISSLLGGIVMLILGLLLILKPNFLRF